VRTTDKPQKIWNYRNVYSALEQCLPHRSVSRSEQVKVNTICHLLSWHNCAVFSLRSSVYKPGPVFRRGIVWQQFVDVFPRCPPRPCSRSSNTEGRHRTLWTTIPSCSTSRSGSRRPAPGPNLCGGSMTHTGKATAR